MAAGPKELDFELRLAARHVAGFALADIGGPVCSAQAGEQRGDRVGVPGNVKNDPH